MRCPVAGSIQWVGGWWAGTSAWTADALFEPRVGLAGFKSDLESIEPARGSSAASVENPMHQTNPHTMPPNKMSQRNCVGRCMTATPRRIHRWIGKVAETTNGHPTLPCFELPN